MTVNWASYSVQSLKTGIVVVLPPGCLGPRQRVWERQNTWLCFRFPHEYETPYQNHVTGYAAFYEGEWGIKLKQTQRLNRSHCLLTTYSTRLCSTLGNKSFCCIMVAAFEYVTLIKGCTTCFISIQMETLIYSPCFLARTRLIMIIPINARIARTTIRIWGKGVPGAGKTSPKIVSWLHVNKTGHYKMYGYCMWRWTVAITGTNWCLTQVYNPVIFSDPLCHMTHSQMPSAASTIHSHQQLSGFSPLIFNPRNSQNYHTGTAMDSGEVLSNTVIDSIRYH